MYHMHVTRNHALALPVEERKWFIDRFIKQKQKENEAVEAERRKAKRK